MRITIDGIIVTVLFFYSLFALTNTHAEQAPVFTLPSENTTISLDQYRGQVIYLDFWASWCNPCQKSFSWMNTMQSRYGDEGFKIVAINLDTSREKAREFLKKNPALFDVVYDPERKTADAYKLSAMPNSFLINKEGEVIYSHKGFDRRAEIILENRIRRLIGYTQVASN
jgi:thiol-disulfide isomerase/thioredoxin